MFDEFNICPYTGLRSFTEEESIYFKGRDEDIEQATSQLEKNKFLMLTGASGDGKSSLVFAGIIPNARAGFLKSRYTDWTIANFRPERSPIVNLSKSLATALDIANAKTVQSELQHGFSALVDLYKSSSRYIDESSYDWQKSDEEERKKASRSSANLIILVDQFEEFFTNPENYIRGTPSEDATLTLNLLLETAKISLKEGLPIYVIFTMRSDYIGQCAAFRGLPEYIGFSQFFVPRLNRKQLQEVIEESAELSGNKISRRLSERLIHDVAEGADQLPILQHALNQIWKAAGNGKEELDLLHYAKVGGLAVSELPEEDQHIFGSWFTTLPQGIQQCYHTPGLNNVLDTHANILYESAVDYVKEKTEKSLSAEDAHLIIRTTFSCLTKIDHSRAVRNRMTLQEIIDILDRKDLDVALVSSVIDIFREPGNTFIHPFISEEGESSSLAPESVLDISHESLIRNWEMLRSWASEEFEKFTIFADFKQQVDRWIEHDRSWGFLLPIGSLTFFSHWYNKAVPNVYWVNRYNEQVTETAKNIDESREIVRNCNDFLRLSTRKHLLANALIRFGPRRISVFLLILAVIVFTSFTLYSNYSKTNAFILGKIKDEGIEIINKGREQIPTAALYLVLRERMEEGSIASILPEIEDKIIRLKILVSMAQYLNTNDKRSDVPIFTESIQMAAAAALEVENDEEYLNEHVSEYFSQLIELNDIATWAYNFHHSEEQLEVSSQTAKSLSKLVLIFLERPTASLSIKELNEAIEIALNYKAFEDNQLDLVLDYLSPFAGKPATRISEFYSRDKSVAIGAVQDKLSFNGLYLELAGLYAASGNLQLTLQSIDSLLKYHPDFERYGTDAYTIAGYFANYEHWDLLEDYVLEYSKRIGMESYIVYRRILDNAGLQPIQHYRKLSAVSFPDNIWVNSLMWSIPEEAIDKVFDMFFESINSAAISADERAFALAQFYKQRGTYHAKVAENQGLDGWETEVFADFDQFVLQYNKISDNYLNEEIQTFFRLGQITARRNIMLYPDYREISYPYEPRTRYNRFISSAFVRFIIERNQMETLYQTRQDLNLITAWVKEYKTGRIHMFFAAYFVNDPSTETLEKLLSSLLAHPKAADLNVNLLKVLLANRYFSEQKMDEAIALARSINAESLLTEFDEEFFWNMIRTFQPISELYTNLSLAGEPETAFSIMKVITDDRNKMRMFDNTAISGYQRGNREIAKQYLDSANSLITKIEQQGGDFFNYRKMHAHAVALDNDENSVSEAKELVSSLFSLMKFNITYRLIVRSTAFNEEYYKAYMAKPALASSEERLATINQILYGILMQQESPEWAEFDRKYNDTFELNGLNL